MGPARVLHFVRWYRFCGTTGAGPIDHATNAMWTQEIERILTRDDAYIFAEPVDRELYPE